MEYLILRDWGGYFHEVFFLLERVNTYAIAVEKMLARIPLLHVCFPESWERYRLPLPGTDS